MSGGWTKKNRRFENHLCSYNQVTVSLMIGTQMVQETLVYSPFDDFSHNCYGCCIHAEFSGF